MEKQFFTVVTKRLDRRKEGEEKDGLIPTPALQVSAHEVHAPGVAVRGQVQTPGLEFREFLCRKTKG